jgi:hypothetical protein
MMPPPSPYVVLHVGGVRWGLTPPRSGAPRYYSSPTRQGHARGAVRLGLRSCESRER